MYLAIRTPRATVAGKRTTDPSETLGTGGEVFEVSEVFGVFESF